MKRILLCVLAVFAGTLAVHAQQLRDMDIRVVLQQDGSARITQIWDATVVDGTEMYIPISNLGEMTVKDLTVSENGQAYINEGRDWDVDRSLDGRPAAAASSTSTTAWNCAGARPHTVPTCGPWNIP